MNWNGGGYPPGQYPQQQQQPYQQQYAPPATFGGGGEFAGLDEADPTGQSLPYFEDGEYLVAIDAIKRVIPRKGGGVNIFVEGTLEESNNGNRPVGMQCSTCIKLNSDMGPINLKRFMAAAMGIQLHEGLKKSLNAPDGRTWTTHAAEMIGPTQPWKGRKVRVRAQTKPKKNSAGNFTEMLWAPAQQGYAQPPQQAQQPQPQMPAYPTQYGMQAPQQPQPQAQPTFNPGQQAQPGFNPPQQAPAFNPGQQAQPAFNPGQAQPAFNPGMPQQAQPAFNPGQPTFNPGQPPQQQPGFNPGAQPWNPPR